MKKKSDSSSSVSVIAIELKQIHSHIHAHTRRRTALSIYTESHIHETYKLTHTHMQHLSPRRDQIKNIKKTKNGAMF